ncbi:MAG TPA: response regulator transcription factor [Ktedonosporobacter sp.]|nr:response regulator transcription factor [Ktedonosporobacter sp.]
MAGATVLLRVQDPAYRCLLERTLTRRMYHAICSDLDDTLLAQVVHHEPEVLLLDDRELVACVPLRQRFRRLSIIGVGDRPDPGRAIFALDQGADDYVAAPFAPAELAARIEALLRRYQQMESKEKADDAVLWSEDGYVVLDGVASRLLVGGQPVHVTPIEWALLHCLMAHAGRVLTHRTVLQQVWGQAYGSEASYVRVYIRHLRTKVEHDPTHPQYILTEPGVGYLFAAARSTGTGVAVAAKAEGGAR